MAAERLATSGLAPMKAIHIQVGQQWTRDAPYAKVTSALNV
jgi:hypothetical protein